MCLANCTLDVDPPVQQPFLQESFDASREKKKHRSDVPESGEKSSSFISHSSDRDLAIYRPLASAMFQKFWDFSRAILNCPLDQYTFCSLPKLSPDACRAFCLSILKVRQLISQFRPWWKWYSEIFTDFFIFQFYEKFWKVENKEGNIQKFSKMSASDIFCLFLTDVSNLITWPVKISRKF